LLDMHKLLIWFVIQLFVKECAGVTLRLQQSSTDDNPIRKVTKLLKALRSTLEEEASEDKTENEKFQCWCTKNRKTIADSVNASQAKLEVYKSRNTSLNARLLELQVNIQDFETDVDVAKKSLDKAISIRSEQKQKYEETTAALSEYIGNLKAAMNIMKKSSAKQSFLGRGHQGSALVETSAGESGLDSFSTSDQAAIDQAVTASSAFIQMNDGDRALIKQLVAPSSMSSLNIVFENLHDEMRDKLKEAQQLEKEQSSSFELIRLAKADEVSSGARVVTTKKAEIASTKNALADTKRNLEEEMKVLDDAKNNQQTIQKSCEEGEKNYQLRFSARSDEIKAVMGAIDALMDTSKPLTSYLQEEADVSFLQISSSHEQRREAISATLKAASKRLGSRRLEVVAEMATTAVVDNVLAAIDLMVKSLTEKKETDENRRNRCSEDLINAKEDVLKATERTNSTTAQLEQAKLEVTSLSTDLDETQASIEKLQLALQSASLNRQKEHVIFQQVVSDHRNTALALNTAMSKLNMFYKKKALLQEQSSKEVIRRSGGFNVNRRYTANPLGGSAIAFLQQLLEKAKAMSASASKSENEAEAAYEKFAADTTQQIQALSEEVVVKSQARATSKEAKVQTMRNLEAASDELVNAKRVQKTLVNECKPLLSNFDRVKVAREAEIEALKDAKNTLKGLSS
jgi:hypothetical protein